MKITEGMSEVLEEKYTHGDILTLINLSTVSYNKHVDVSRNTSIQ